MYTLSPNPIKSPAFPGRSFQVFEYNTEGKKS